MQIFLITLAVVLIIGFFAGVLVAYCNSENKKLKIGLGVALSVSVIFAAIVPGSVHQVETGSVAVVKRLGVVKEVCRPGLYFDFWMTKKYVELDTTIRKVDIETASYSKDAQAMDISMSIQYQVLNDDESLKRIITEYSNIDSLETRIIKVTEDKVKSILSSSTAMHIIETRGSLSPEIETALKTALTDAGYPVDLKGANIVDINFSDAFEKAVEDKVIAEQQKEAAITKAEQELEVAKFAAQSKIEEARGNAESQKIIAAAEGSAATLKIVELARTLGFDVVESYRYLITRTSETEVSTTEVVSEIPLSEGEFIDDGTKAEVVLLENKYTINYDAEHTAEYLNTAVIKYLEYLAYLEKWNGELPDVVSGDNALEIIVPKN